MCIYDVWGGLVVMIMLFVIIMWRELVMIKAPTSLSRKVSKTVKKSLFF